LENSGIFYEYEPFYIPTEDGRYYLPDFLIYLDTDKILLEIKGVIRGKSGKCNEIKKIKAAESYCDKLGIRFVYLTKKLDNIKDLKG
jgi:restriction endonuclease